MLTSVRRVGVVAVLVTVVAAGTGACAFDGNEHGAPATEQLPPSATTTGPASPDPSGEAGGTAEPSTTGVDPGTASAPVDPGTSTGGDSPSTGTDTTSGSETTDAPLPSEPCPEHPSLVACWDFDFGSIDDNGLMPDGTPNALDATTSGLTWAEGPLGDAARLDAQSLVYVGATAALDLEEAITIEAWISIDPAAAAGDRRRGIFDHQGQYAMFYYPGQGIRCSGLTEVFGAIAPPEAGRWMHVACTFGEGRLRAYVDGEIAAEVGLGEPQANPGSKLVALGNNTPRFDAPFLGAMSRVRVWDIALSPEAIATTAAE